MDALDKNLVQMLQENSKRTVKQYANALGLSPTAVHERIKRLEHSGVIAKYVALADPKRLDRNLIVFCQVRLASHSKAQIATFEHEVMALDEVMECYHVSGDYDYLLKLRVSDMPEYRRFLVNKLTAIPHIGNTQSSFGINEVKFTTAIQPPSNPT